MKIPLQNKIAELERRIVALEQGRNFSSSTTTTTTTERPAVDIDTELSGLWKSFDTLMAKAFGKR